MEHVVALESMHGTVHAVLSDEETWCHWQYLSTETLNGHRVPRAATTTDPLTCYRCYHQMAGLVNFRMRKELTPSQVEDILNLSTKMVLEN